MSRIRKMAACNSDDDTMSNGTSHHVTHALEFMTEEEGKEFQEFRRSIGIVGTFTKQMVKMAIAQLKPEFENMAVKAAEQAFDNKMTKVRELNEELNKRERELKQLRLEKKILQAKLDKERVVKSRPDSVETKEKELKRMEADISNLKMKLRKTTDDLKHERDRLSEEEKKRLELESTLQADVERLRKELDRVKGQLGQLRSAKNVGDDETRKLRERERQLLDEMEMIRKQQPRLHKRKLFA
ncbi:uncharacterized protein LOC143053230 isoform X1 [Mytilus galloprovincialis]|uniref:Uncharacterized protein n=3 Tax=Mytilus TaxID=6548 RepID=A0A8B6HG46_MYTGA|nr:Hypothetical predicted protein [Mytilus galloprovincialis]